MRRSASSSWSRSRLRGLEAYQTPYHWAAAYGISAALLLVLGRFGTRPEVEPGDDPGA